MEVIRAAPGGAQRRRDAPHPRGVPGRDEAAADFLPSDKVALLLNLVELDMFDHQMDIDAFELYVAIPKLCLNDVGEWGDAQR